MTRELIVHLLAIAVICGIVFEGLLMWWKSVRR